MTFEVDTPILNSPFAEPGEHWFIRPGHPPEHRAGRRPALVFQPRDQTGLDAAIRLVLALDHGVLPIQGPPGAGKTFTGARMILALLAQGKRVGVTATSHKVIGNLLKEVCEAARHAGQSVRAVQKAKEEDWCGISQVEWTDDNDAVLTALRSGRVSLAAGTAWLWSRDDMAAAVDVLFIDEAGQFALANAIAVASAARSLVLLGDPRQLQQPQQGLHPPGAEVSALDHLLGGRETMPSDRGLFLERGTGGCTPTSAPSPRRSTTRIGSVPSRAWSGSGSMAGRSQPGADSAGSGCSTLETRANRWKKPPPSPASSPT